MSIKLPIVTVPAHYSFLTCLRFDHREDTCDDYEVTIIKSKNGDFKVTGPEAHLKSFADDICAGDRQSAYAIMTTIK